MGIVVPFNIWASSIADAKQVDCHSVPFCRYDHKGIVAYYEHYASADLSNFVDWGSDVGSRPAVRA